MFRIEGSPRNDNAEQSNGMQRELNLFYTSGAMNLAYEAIKEVS